MGLVTRTAQKWTTLSSVGVIMNERIVIKQAVTREITNKASTRRTDTHAGGNVCNREKRDDTVRACVAG